ncbi:hypothetical protein GCM10025858_31550 [Alicyclobacillus sacchari]|nr:hypothetical protein GCM10025858_31550 [Alicyclobacillus sacchari]
MATHIDVLRELCDAYGISGYESGVRKLFEQHLSPCRSKSFAIALAGSSASRLVMPRARKCWLLGISTKSDSW